MRICFHIHTSTFGYDSRDIQHVLKEDGFQLIGKLRHDYIRWCGMCLRWFLDCCKFHLLGRWLVLPLLLAYSLVVSTTSMITWVLDIGFDNKV